MNKGEQRGQTPFGFRASGVGKNKEEQRGQTPFGFSSVRRTVAGKSPAFFWLFFRHNSPMSADLLNPCNDYVFKRIFAASPLLLAAENSREQKFIVKLKGSSLDFHLHKTIMRLIFKKPRVSSSTLCIRGLTCKILVAKGIHNDGYKKVT